MINILIVDDHHIVRNGLKQIVADLPDMKVVAECSYGYEVFSRLKDTECNLVLLDISIPGRSGLEILAQLHAERPDLPILILSMYPEDRYAVRALRAGAAGYVTKMSASDELVTAIRKVYWGGKYVSESLSQILAADLGKQGDTPTHEKLSDRELQVLCMLGSGKTCKEIAGELILSIKTISTYRKRILEKTGLKNNADIVNYVLVQGLLD